ncbi:T9SS type A sorting domain-containing protein [Pedobacter psychrophilus]
MFIKKFYYFLNQQIQNLNSGTYIIRIKDDNLSFQEKIIKK